MRGVALVVVGALAAVLVAPPARAFCRSTTCTDDCPTDHSGCKTTGAPLAWPGRCVGYSVQRDGTANLPMSEVAPAIEAAFAAWSGLGCAAGGHASMELDRLDDVACHEAEYSRGGPNANIVMFQDDKWTFDGVDDQLARTTVTFDTTTGEIWDADIELDYAYNEFTVGDGRIVYDLQSAVTHEVGHFLGLDHSSDSAATMNAAYVEGSTVQRTLAPDDIAGACKIYPPGRDAACDTTPDGGFTSECVGGGCSVAGRYADGWPGVAWLVFGLAFAQRRRR